MRRMVNKDPIGSCFPQAWTTQPSSLWAEEGRPGRFRRSSPCPLVDLICVTLGILILRGSWAHLKDLQAYRWGDL